MQKFVLCTLLLLGAFSMNIHDSSFPHKAHPLEELKKSEWG